jgi:hypothetical protein
METPRASHCRANVLLEVLSFLAMEANDTRSILNVSTDLCTSRMPVGGRQLNGDRCSISAGKHRAAYMASYGRRAAMAVLSRGETLA